MILTYWSGFTESPLEVRLDPRTGVELISPPGFTRSSNASAPNATTDAA
jgi:hypothetical protein